MPVIYVKLQSRSWRIKALQAHKFTDELEAIYQRLVSANYEVTD